MSSSSLTNRHNDTVTNITDSDMQSSQQHLFNWATTFPNTNIIMGTIPTPHTTTAVTTTDTATDLNIARKIPGSGSSSEFLQKTYSIINDCDPSVATWWNEGFVIKDPDQFSSNWLPQYFRTNKFESFTRQLKYYGFKKFQRGMEGRSVGFFHEFFKPGSPDQWHKIKRSTNGSKIILHQEQDRNDLGVVADVDEFKAIVQDLKTEVSELKNLVNDLRRISNLQVEMMMRSGFSSSHPSTTAAAAGTPVGGGITIGAANHTVTASTSMPTSSHIVGTGAGIWNAHLIGSTANNLMMTPNWSNLHPSPSTKAVASNEPYPPLPTASRGITTGADGSSVPSLLPPSSPMDNPNITEPAAFTPNPKTNMIMDPASHPNELGQHPQTEHHHPDSNKEEAALALAALSENANVQM